MSFRSMKIINSSKKYKNNLISIFDEIVDKTIIQLLQYVDKLKFIQRIIRMNQIRVVIQNFWRVVQKS